MSAGSRISIASSAAFVMFCAGCVATPVDHAARYRGPIPPCDVEVGGPALGEAPRPPAGADLWLPGPFAAWNTHPAPGCNANPVIPAGDGEEFQLYITYPTLADPAFTGQGDVAPGRFPVVVFSHANNDTACNIFERYFSLHDHWASRGFIVVSVDQTDQNCSPGNRTNISDRAARVREALGALDTLDADPQSRFHGRIDTSRVVLAGHSRGAGASFVAARGDDSVKGIITLQGIDPTVFGFAAGLPAVPVLGITAGNDVDLHFPRVDVVEDRLRGPYTWVNLNGGAHAYTADSVPLEFDDRPGITREIQHDVTELFTTAFLLHTLADEPQDDVLWSLDGAAAASEITAHGVYMRWRTPAPDVWIDRFDGSDSATNDLGLATQADGFRRAAEVYTYRPDDDEVARRWRSSRALILDSTGHAIYTTRVDVAGPLDASSTPALTFRARGPDFGVTAPFDVLFETTDGTDSVPIDASHRGPLPIGNRFQQVVVPLPRPQAALRAVSIAIRGGTLFVDDLRFAAPTP